MAELENTIIAQNIRRVIKRFLSFIHKNWQKRNIATILKDNRPPIFYDSDKIFENLQKFYKISHNYGYDAYSSWHRGMSRAQKLLKGCDGLRQPNLKVLDVACGDGMAGYALSTFGHDVTLNDIEDWRDDRWKNLPMVIGNLCGGLLLNSNNFDLVISYNSFEHISDPQAAFEEILRVTKPGGIIYLEFGPLYCSPKGLHAYHTLNMSYPQFIFSMPFLEKKLQLLGIRDLGKERKSLQPVNAWRLKQFEDLWNSKDVEILDHVLMTDYSRLGVVRRFPRSFSGLDLSLEDLTTYGISLTLLKIQSLKS
jgi:SAM-dependent methyltransferase